MHYGSQFSSVAASSILKNLPLSPCVEARLLIVFFCFMYVCAFLWRGLCAMSVLENMFINKPCLQTSECSSCFLFDS